MRIVPHGFVVRNAMAWYRMNLAVLHNPDVFTLPGYSVEKGVHLGRNVVMERGTEVKGPVLLQDNVWCARNVRLDGDVIVGKGSFVSEDAHIARTIICDNTFIGPGLELIDKIVAGSHVIDAATGEWTDIEEPGIARRIGEDGGWLRGLWRFLQGASRGRRR
jgi:NDP-sugar pyrophosphorylase family protein